VSGIALNGAAGRVARSILALLLERGHTLAAAFEYPGSPVIGTKVGKLIQRDDIDTAEKHRRFYEQFGCPTAHIGMALRCLIRSDLPPAPTQGNVQQGQAHAKALAERVEQCWDKPSMNYLNR